MTDATQTALTAQIVAMHDVVTSIKVTDAVTYERAAGFLTQAMGLKKSITDYFKPLKEAAHKAHKAITTRESEELAKLAPIEAHLKGQIGVYDAEQRRLAAIEQARLDAERAAAQKKIDEERAAAQRKIDEESAALRRAEEEKRAAAAAEAKRKGDEAEAARIAALPPPVVAPKVALPPAPVLQRTVVAAETPKVAGVATKTVWDFEIEDVAQIPRAFMIPDEKKIREHVQALKGDAKILCVRVFSRATVTASDSATVRAYGYVVVRIFDATCGVELFGASLATLLSSVKAKIKKASKYAAIQKMPELGWFGLNGVAKSKMITLYKRVSKDFKTQEKTERETIWEIGSTLEHPRWDPQSGECGAGKFHACAQPFFCDQFRDTPGDVYIAISVALDDVHEWKGGQYPHKIAFRKGKVLYQCDKLGTRIGTPAAETPMPIMQAAVP